MKEIVGITFGIIALIAQFIAYWAVYDEHGFFSLTSVWEISIMTLFPPYAWWTAAKFLEVF